MLYAIFSDIHANPQAFDKAAADAREQGAERCLCLGDVVGYGPDPHGAVKRVRAVCGVTLMGNHDAATAGLIDTWNFRTEARVQAARHARMLDHDELEWLRQRKYVYRAPGGAFVAAHGTLAHPMDFGYIFRESEARMAFAELARKGLRLLFAQTRLSEYGNARRPAEQPVIPYDVFTFRFAREAQVHAFEWSWRPEGMYTDYCGS